jgi:hypothetical protein
LFLRLSIVMTLVAVMILAIPGVLQADTPSSTTKPFIEVTAVNKNKEITVSATNFPANVDFYVRIGPYASFFSNQKVMLNFNSGTGGSFKFNVALPDIVKDVDLVTIRVDSLNVRPSIFAYNAFHNVNLGTVNSTPSPTPTTTVKPAVDVIAIEKNTRITVSASGFPANIYFSVRIGPYYTFGRDQQVVQTFNSGNGGSFIFNVDLPAIVKEVDLITIRLDSVSGSTHYVAYNAFYNKNLGTISNNPTVPSLSTCQIISVSPTQSMAVKTDFDAIWTVKNTSTVEWNNHETDYKYSSGDKFNKYSGIYDLPKLVKPGDTVKLVADMIAPSTAGTYTTVFVVTGPQGVVCNLPLTITVK